MLIVSGILSVLSLHRHKFPLVLEDINHITKTIGKTGAKGQNNFPRPEQEKLN